MLSKVNVELPYFSDLPLSPSSRWVAFPLLIRVKDTNYSSGLEKGKSIVTEIEKMAQSIVESDFKLEPPVFEGTENKPETTVEFSKGNSDWSLNIYHSVYLTFGADIDVWRKLQITSKYLDNLESFCSTYEKNKTINIDLGVRFYKTK